MGPILKALREERGLSQAAVVALTGGKVSQSQLSRYEAGVSAATFSAAVALAKTYGVSIADLAYWSQHGYTRQRP